MTYGGWGNVHHQCVVRGKWTGLFGSFFCYVATTFLLGEAGPPYFQRNPVFTLQVGGIRGKNAKKWKSKGVISKV